MSKSASFISYHRIPPRENSDHRISSESSHDMSSTSFQSDRHQLLASLVDLTVSQQKQFITSWLDQNPNHPLYVEVSTSLQVISSGSSSSRDKRKQLNRRNRRNRQKMRTTSKFRTLMSAYFTTQTASNTVH